ncbi:MAG: ATP-binding protein [Bradymonadia bacterium]
MTQPVIVMDRSGHCVGLNAAFAQVIEAPEAEALGQPVEQLFVQWPSSIKGLGTAGSGTDAMHAEAFNAEQQPWAVTCNGDRLFSFALSCAPLEVLEGEPLEYVTLTDVSDHLESCESTIHTLNEAAHHMSEVFEQAMGGMMLLDGRTRRVMKINPAMCKLLQRTRTDVEHQLINQIFTEPQLSAQLEKMVIALEGGSEHEQQGVQLIRHRGRQMHVEVNASRLQIEDASLFLITAHDITLYRQAMRAVVEWQQRYSAAVRATKQVLFEWSPVQDKLSVGEGGPDLFKLEPKALPRVLGDWILMVHPDDRAEVIQAFDDCRHRGQPVHIDYRMHQGNGAWITIRHDADLVLDRQGTPVHLVGFLADITMQQELESHLRQSTKMEAIGRLAGGVAHDFNNLLTSILSYAELAALATEKPLVRNDLIKVIKSAKKASALTRKLLAFSRRQVVSMKAFNLNTVVAETLSLARPLMEDYVQVDHHLDPNVPQVYADVSLMEQIVLNLVVNARDAMPSGGVVTVSTKVVESESGPQVLLQVADTGVGMTPEVQAHIFEPFFTTKPQGEGTGLGLSMVYGAVEQCRGMISLESAVGEGTIFSVTFPPYDLSPILSSGEMVALDLKHYGDMATSGAEFQARILVVEDDDALRELVKRVLEDGGHEVMVAAGYAQAMEIIRLDKAFDLVLTDVMMPGESGLQVVESIKSQAPHVKSLFMSGYPDEIVESQGPLPEGATLLAKPFSPPELSKVVREILQAPAEGQMLN